MAIIFYCYKCGQKGEFKTKKDMQCDCGHYIKKRNNAKDHVNMRNTWAKTTKLEFNEITMDESIKNMRKNN